ncbi:MAG TPA: XcyI family restriction endonuclease [Firmicutes bacterium]|nr:XcyI family restriction endonuclease [Candidatus Fermentithermobacillaceae bacterium]
MSAPVPYQQITFAKWLREVQNSLLQEGLRKTLSEIDTRLVDEELHHLVPDKYLKRLSTFLLRGEILFPVPCIIQHSPNLAGYYRLVLGLSRKECEKYPTLKKFLVFEPVPGQEHQESPHDNTGVTEEDVKEFCNTLIKSACMLLDELGDLTADFLRDLSLLTLGAQFRGSYNNLIGREAAGKVFQLITVEVGRRARRVISHENGWLVIENAAGREVTFRLGADPDILVTEKLSDGRRGILAIEVKGGTDRSNIHNRLGEAEKTHLKCKENNQAQQFWTVVGVRDLDLNDARRESPTTSRFFRMEEILTGGPTQQSFLENLAALVGVRFKPNDSL